MEDGREVATEVFDVGQLDRVIRYRSWEHEDENGRITRRTQTKQEEIPEDLMALNDYIGDGLAKVTVGAELGHSKEYGCKAQAFVSISVHCNNDDGTIEEVQNILHDKARVFVNQDLEEMIQDRDRWMTEDKAGETGGRLARPPAKPQPRTNPKAQSQGRVRTRPSYRR